MRKLIALIAIGAMLALSGCGHTPDKENTSLRGASVGGEF